MGPSCCLAVVFSPAMTMKFSSMRFAAESVFRALGAIIPMANVSVCLCTWLISSGKSAKNFLLLLRTNQSPVEEKTTKQTKRDIVANSYVLPIMQHCKHIGVISTRTRGSPNLHPFDEVHVWPQGEGPHNMSSCTQTTSVLCTSPRFVQHGCYVRVRRHTMGLGWGSPNIKLWLPSCCRLCQVCACVWTPCTCAWVFEFDLVCTTNLFIEHLSTAAKEIDHYFFDFRTDEVALNPIPLPWIWKLCQRSLEGLLIWILWLDIAVGYRGPSTSSLFCCDPVSPPKNFSKSSVINQ